MSVKFIEDIETEKFQLEVHQCECGFYIGLDATYLDQVDSITLNCPNCAKIIHIKQYE